MIVIKYRADDIFKSRYKIPFMMEKAKKYERKSARAI